MADFPMDNVLLLRSSVADFLAQEADHLDEQNWDAWLALHEEAVEYWIPSWESEHEYTSNPQGEISLIYYNSRAGLEDRVFRIRTKRSAASTPLPRTCHMISNIIVRPDSDESNTVSVKAKWVTHLYRKAEETQFFGRCHYVLAWHGEDWKIRKKKTLVLNDRIPTVLDIYSV